MIHLFLYFLLPTAQSGETGESCFGREGWEGLCTLSYDCRSLGGLIPRGFSPELCNITSEQPVVCCPDILFTQELPVVQRQIPVRRVTYIRPHTHLYLKVIRPMDDEVEVVREVVRRRRKPVVRLKPLGTGRRRKRRPQHHPHRHNYIAKRPIPIIAASTLNYVFNEAPTSAPPSVSKRPAEALAEASMDFQAVYSRTSDVRKNRPKRVSQIKCEDYGNMATENVAELSKYGVVPIKVEKCSFTNVNYESGAAAGIAEFPHVAGVGYDDGNLVIWGCAGSLISENFILTAAHCTDSALGKPSRVRLGEVRLGVEGSRRSLGVQERTVSDVIVHGSYDPSTREGDLALLRTIRSLRLTDHVRPACLHHSQKLGTRTAIAADWTSLESLTEEIKLGKNKTNRFSEESDAVGLRKSSLELVENKKCLLPASSSDGYLCVVNTLPCSEDGGGGPLQIRNDGNKCMYNIIGIASSQTCAANKPAIYTKISHYLSWIEDKVWP